MSISGWQLAELSRKRKRKHRRKRRKWPNNWLRNLPRQPQEPGHCMKANIWHTFSRPCANIGPDVDVFATVPMELAEMFQEERLAGFPHHMNAK